MQHRLKSNIERELFDIFDSYRKNSEKSKKRMHDAADKYKNHYETLFHVAMHNKHIRKFTQLVKYIIQLGDQEAINALALKYHDNIKALYPIVEYGRPTNINAVFIRNDCKWIYEPAQYIEKDIINIFLLSKGANMHLVSADYLDTLLFNGGAGILINKYPSLVTHNSAEPYVKRHEDIKLQLLLYLPTALVNLILEYVLYEKLVYHRYVEVDREKTIVEKTDKNVYDMDVFNHLIRRGFSY